jgi:hypothetical protein
MTSDRSFLAFCHSRGKETVGNDLGPVPQNILAENPGEGSQMSDIRHLGTSEWVTAGRQPQFVI